MAEQSSAAYAIGRIRARQRNQMDKGRLERLVAAASEDEIAAILREMDWGTSADLSKLPDEFLKEQTLFFRSVVPDAAVAEAFLYEYDTANIKMLLKARCMGLTEDVPLSECGLIPLQTLEHDVAQHRYNGLNEILVKALDELEKRLSVSSDPLDIDITLDKAYYALAFSSLGARYPLIREYFTYKVDFLNCISLIRVIAMGKSESLYLRLFIDGGTIEKEQLLSAIDSPEKLPRLYAKFGRDISSAIESAQSSQIPVAQLEKQMDDASYKLFMPQRNTATETETVVEYYLRSRREASVARILIAAAVNGFSPDAVRERMRDMYV
ncbi:MAG: V-type ATPase subunit [Eubacteriales bacterium]|nr:V-type ATPase subunit [Eubacteriales bacterium]MDD3882189.1 V-type ATPase subunit [Eubacteriales bacterium]MDD4512538.1 V-type ATPase subunit [Eubacteriales bacterium]